MEWLELKELLKKQPNKKYTQKTPQHTAKSPESLDSAEMNKQAGPIHHE